ncbi:MAG: asparagine synthase (glutamine-hydrolyzing) [Halioglobus sp.]
MCGIAGYINLNGAPMDRERDGPVLEAMGRAMAYRGPDDTQSMLWDNVGFIFKRLSIVDLGGGRQPFEVGNGRVCAMANGEIYNHRAIRTALAPRWRLDTQSDCEVLPYLYLERGLDLLAPVNGMFATAILDRHEKRLLLARDRIGIKPLFYCVTPDNSAFVFASELKALFAHPSVPRDFDWRAALAQDNTLDTRGRELPSFFRGIERLPAGHLLDLSLATGRFTVQPYWHKPPRDDGHARQSVDDYVAGYRDLLEDSVKLRLMTDVGLGVFLSGGIDSAAVAAIAARHMAFPTFSVSSRSTVGSGDVEASLLVAKHLGLVNHQVYFDHDRTRITPDHWREVLWACEYPLASAEQLYKYFLHGFAHERYPNLKVMLLGQGVDELAGGYMEWTLGERLAWDASHWPQLTARMRQIETLRATKDAGYLREYEGLIHHQVLAQDFVCESVGRSLQRSTLDLYQGYYRQNLDNHLWHEDRTSAAHSIESRVPFLDHRLLEFIARVPVEHHPRLFMDKKILRMAVRDLLPPQIVARPKGYFFFGREQARTFQLMYSILIADDRELIEQAIAGSAATRGPLNPGRFHDYVTDVGSDGEYKEVARLLKLVNMGLLAHMAANGRAGVDQRGPLPVRELSGAELQTLINPAGETAAAGHAAIEQWVPTLAPGVRLVAGAAGEAAHLALPEQGPVRIASPDWETFLRALDGRRTAGEIIATHRLPKLRTLRQLRDGLEEGVIVRGFQHRD